MGGGESSVEFFGGGEKVTSAQVLRQLRSVVLGEGGKRGRFLVD